MGLRRATASTIYKGIGKCVNVQILLVQTIPVLHQKALLERRTHIPHLQQMLTFPNPQHLARLTHVQIQPYMPRKDTTMHGTS